LQRAAASPDTANRQARYQRVVKSSPPQRASFCHFAEGITDGRSAAPYRRSGNHPHNSG
jgi:hypothetical protein